MKTTFHFKNEIQTYLEGECIRQQETRRLMNIKLTNFESCNILSIKSIKFKKHHENTSS
jgi:hypothetical protein